MEVWRSGHSLLAEKKGDVEDHAVLLCNLLLGFGLDAFVAVGVSIKGPHVWVITRARNEDKSLRVTFWESITGNRFDLGRSINRGPENFPLL